MLNVAVSVVENHDITVDPHFGTPGRGGKYYALWYPLLSAVAIPFAAAGIAAARHVHLPEPYVVAVAALLLSTIIAAANVAATAWLAIRLGVSKLYAVYAGVVLGFCTLALRYARTFYADPLLTLIVTVGIGLALEEGHEYALALCVALAILAKPPGIFFGAIVLAHALFTKRQKRAWAVFAGLAVGALLYMGYDFARFGDVAKTGQPNFWDLSSAPVAALGLLFSPSVGLLIGCPIVLLAIPLWRKGKVIWATTLVLLVFYATWGRWYASDWGPRFLMPVIPALVALSALTARKRLWAALAILGFVIQMPTLLGTPERYQEQLREQGIAQGDDAWRPLLSPTVAMWPSAFEQIREARETDVASFVKYRAHANVLSDARNYRIVPLWWWMLPLVHIPRAFGIAVSLFLTAAGAWLILTVYEAKPRREFAPVTSGQEACANVDTRGA
jgi:hypothetical protein